MKVKNKTNSYHAFIAREGFALIEDLKGIAYTAEVLGGIIGDERAYELAKGLSRQRFDSWLELSDNKEHGDGIIRIINPSELTEYILNVLSLSFVERIYEFCMGGKYQLWIIVNEYNINVCKAIYKNSLNLCDVDILIIEMTQIDCKQMPTPTFIFNKE